MDIIKDPESNKKEWVGIDGHLKPADDKPLTKKDLDRAAHHLKLSPQAREWLKWAKENGKIKTRRDLHHALAMARASAHQGKTPDWQGLQQGLEFGSLDNLKEASKEESDRGARARDLFGAHDELQQEIKNFSFGDTKEAEDFAKRRFSHILWDFSGCDVTTVTPVVHQFFKLSNGYPDVVKKLKYVGVGTDKRVESSHPYAFAKTYNSDHLWLNPLFFSNPDVFEEALEDSTETGFHPEGCSNFESVLTHEFSYSVINYLLSQASLAITKFASSGGPGSVSDLVNRFVGETYHNYADATLSLYATRSPMAAWAEGFSSLYHTPDSDRSEYVKRLSLFMDALRKTKWLKLGSWTSLDDLEENNRKIALESIYKSYHEFGVKHHLDYLK